VKDKGRKSEHERNCETGVDVEGFARRIPGLNYTMNDGTEAHKILFCQSFIESHRRFEPADLPWPILDEASIDRLRSIPFWSVALAAERNAGRMVAAFARTLEDPLIREATEVQGVEEDRHARLLDEMLRVYGISVAERPLPPADSRERAFLDFGYEECIDSFFGFGIFGLARKIQLFVPELTDIFEIVLLEEARHVTFFVNWIAYERIRRGRGAPAFQALSTGLGYVRAVRRIVTTFAPAAKKGGKTQGVGFGAEGAFALFSDVTWRSFLQSCVDGNDRYMATTPAELLKPTVLATLARLALRIPPLGSRKPAIVPNV
jgi:hypothetical protein